MKDSSRIDPGIPWDVVAVGSVQFDLPGAEVSGSPDEELYQALLKGDFPGGGYWGQMEYEASSLLGDKSIDEAREIVASRLAGRGPENEIIARAMLHPAVAFIWEKLIGEAADLLGTCPLTTRASGSHPGSPNRLRLAITPIVRFLCRAMLHPAAVSFVTQGDGVLMN